MEKVEVVLHKLPFLDVLRLKLWRRLMIALHAKDRGYGVSIIVPLCLTMADGQRYLNWKWLKEYWEAILPDAEMIIGVDTGVQHGLPFSKSAAVNYGASRATGDVFVIVDIDAYISREAIVRCIDEIRLAERRGNRLWFVPYRQLYRLSVTASTRLLCSDPKNPFPFPTPPKEEDFTNKGEFTGRPVSQIGHRYGAMIQVASRRAFDIMGGWDWRFRGWGGEDHAAMTSMDTLYAAHKTLPTAVLHVWHPTLIPPSGKTRLWGNQELAATNDVLSGRYYWSLNHPQRMRRLVSEFKNREWSYQPRQALTLWNYCEIVKTQVLRLIK